ncbi:MAG TPA: hypothetical protein VMU89_19430 [Thermomicrobiaceae bacterium]|nr:hypothetical protein [Thermomicrobiaceae bacterium]
MPAEGSERTKLLTFESWVSRWEWFEYARANPEHVPILLVDRSPCQDPFFDPYARSHGDRRPLITGLCRLRKNFRVGERFIYLTRIDPRVSQALGIYLNLKGSSYLGVAALEVVSVWPSHAAAALSFSSRRYVVEPMDTPYPPNLAFDHEPVAAAVAASCIVHDARNRAYTPSTARDGMWKGEYREYRSRQEKHQLRAAECRLEVEDGREALQLDPCWAPVLTSQDWDGQQMNQNGIWIGEEQPVQIWKRIALSTAGI